MLSFEPYFLTFLITIVIQNESFDNRKLEETFVFDKYFIMALFHMNCLPLLCTVNQFDKQDR